jgi:DNA-binding response OmpR family regulator
MLALKAGQVASPGELLESVWGYEATDSEARELLKVHIRRLRQKLRAISPEGADYIQSVRGFGYRLVPPT